jgi:hypothetical protein
MLTCASFYVVPHQMTVIPIEYATTRDISQVQQSLPLIPSALLPAQLNIKLRQLPLHDLFQCLHTRLRSVRRPHPGRFACLHKTKDLCKCSVCVCRRGSFEHFDGKLASQWGEARTVRWIALQRA